MIDRIMETLQGMLSDSSLSVRIAASAAMDRLRARKSKAAYLERLRVGTLEEKVRIVFAAEEIGGSEGVALLLAALSDGEAEVRGAAVRALESTPSPQVLKALVAQLPRENGVVLGNLLEALGKSSRKELAPILEKYLDHPDFEIRGKAIVAYARIAEGEGWKHVLRYSGAESETVRAAAARALGEWSAER